MFTYKRVVNTTKGLQYAAEFLQNTAEPIYYDIETTGLNPHHDKVHIVVVAAEDTIFAIDCHALSAQDVYTALKPIFETHLVIGHNVAFDAKFALAYDVNVNTAHCTMHIERILTAGLLVPQGFSLKSLVSKYCGVTLEKDTREDFIGNPYLQLEQRHFDYAMADVQYLPRIYDLQMQQVIQHDLDRVYYLECQLIPVVALMEFTGVCLDKSGLESLIPQLQKLVQDSEKALQRLFITHGAANHILFEDGTYTAINLNSKPQMYEALDAVGINPTDNKGNPSLNAKSVLRWDAKNNKEYDIAETLGLSDEDDNSLTAILTAFDGLRHPILRAHALYTAATKLLDSYVLGTLEKYDPITQRVYGWFSQTGARSTGRFSSDMQQIPKDKKLERLSVNGSIRKHFVAAPKHKFLIADYSGIELVILADLSHDDKLEEIVVKNATGEDDLHLYVVRHAFTEIHPMAHLATVDKKKQPPFTYLREASKPTSYGIAYGITHIALSETITKELAPLGIVCRKEDAQGILDGWKYKAFAKAGKWLDKTGKKAVRDGYVTTLWGRRRWFDLEFAEKNKWRKFAIEREGCNAPIQGTCADMMKWAMVLIYRKLDRNLARIVLTVHDELVIEAHDSYVEQAAEIMKWGMEQAARDILERMGKYVNVSVAVSERYDK